MCVCIKKYLSATRSSMCLFLYVRIAYQMIMINGSLFARMRRFLLLLLFYYCSGCGSCCCCCCCSSFSACGQSVIAVVVFAAVLLFFFLLHLLCVHTYILWLLCWPDAMKKCFVFFLFVFLLYFNLHVRAFYFMNNS